MIKKWGVPIYPTLLIAKRGEWAYFHARKKSKNNQTVGRIGGYIFMYGVSDKDYPSFKKMCEEGGIKYKTEEEYREATRNLHEYVKLALDMAVEQNRWKQRLKEEPDGFWIDSEGRTCFVCRRGIAGQIWFDKWGLKCENCQAAFKKKIFPGYILRDKDNSRHITDLELSWKFKLQSQTIKKLVRAGLLKPRVVPNGPMIFLKQENPRLGPVLEEYKSRQSG